MSLPANYLLVKQLRPDLYERICVASGLPDYELRAFVGKALQGRLANVCAGIEGTMMDIVAELLQPKEKNILDSIDDFFSTPIGQD